MSTVKGSKLISLLLGVAGIRVNRNGKLNGKANGKLSGNWGGWEVLI